MHAQHLKLKKLTKMELIYEFEEREIKMTQGSIRDIVNKKNPSKRIAEEKMEVVKKQFYANDWHTPMVMLSYTVKLEGIGISEDKAIEETFYFWAIKRYLVDINLQVTYQIQLFYAPPVAPEMTTTGTVYLKAELQEKFAGYNMEDINMAIKHIEALKKILL